MKYTSRTRCANIEHKRNWRLCFSNCLSYFFAACSVHLANKFSIYLFLDLDSLSKCEYK